MSHLNDVGHTYVNHLFRAWKLSFILFVHGIFPFIWETKASDELCKNKSNKTRAYLLEKQYGIIEKNNADL